MRGLPASGKTTYAKQWVSEDPCNRLRVNRDDLRAMLHDSAYVKPEPGTGQTRKAAAKNSTEQTVIRMRDKLIDEALCSGISVVSDDCNLSAHNVKELTKIAKRCGAELSIIDLTNVPLEDCLLRDYKRGFGWSGRNPSVGERVIGDMYQRYLKGKDYPLPVPVVKELVKGERRQYAADISLPPAVIFDIDGTLAHMNGRSPYDYSQVHTDTPDVVLYELHWFYKNAGYNVIFLSGRPGSCRQETENWLKEHITAGADVHLLMRSAADKRDDAQVKYELFDQHVRDNYQVRMVYDDRNRVVDMWRSIGLKCLQVEPGDF